LNLLLHNKIRFWVFGEGKYTEYLKKTGKGIQHTENGYFLGLFTVKEMTNYMLQADAAIIPHLKMILRIRPYPINCFNTCMPVSQFYLQIVYL